MNDKIDINDLEWVAGVADDLDEIADELKEVNKLLKELDDYLEDNNFKKEIYFGFVDQSKDLDEIKDNVQIIRRAAKSPVSSYGYEMDMSIANIVDLCIDQPFHKKMEKTVARLAKADISNYTAENSGGIVVEEETWEPGIAISAPSTRVVKLVTPKRLTINDILSSPFSKAMRKKQYQEYLKLLYPDLSDKSIGEIDTKLLYDMYLKSQLDIADFDYLTQIEEGLNGLRKLGLGLGLMTIAIVLSPATAALLGTGATVITVSSTAVNGFLSIVDVISLISGKDINGNELTKAERDSLLASVVIDGAFLAGSIYSKIQLNNVGKVDPLADSKIAREIVEDSDAVYGYRPKPGSSLEQFDIDWSNVEEVAKAKAARIEYLEAMKLKKANLDKEVSNYMNDGKNLNEIAEIKVNQRNADRINSYIKNGDYDNLEKLYERNLIEYGNKEGPNVAQLYIKYGSYEEIIYSSIRVNQAMNILLGIKK